MRFKLLARAVFLLLILFVLAPPTPAQFSNCRIMDSSGTCIQTQFQFAFCHTTATCGPDCPSPPFDNGTFPLIAVAEGINYCPEPAIVNVRTGTAPYEVFSVKNIEGYFSHELFQNFVVNQYCGGFIENYGEVNPCSQCRTYDSTGACYNSGSSVPLSCVTTANCLVGPCYFGAVGAGMTVNHSCPNPNAINCTVRSDSDSRGAFASGYCTWYWFWTLIEGYSYQDCDGGYDSVGAYAACPRMGIHN